MVSYQPDAVSVTQPTVSKAPKKMQCIDSLWPGLILSSSIIGLLMEGTFFSLVSLSDATFLSYINMVFDAAVRIPVYLLGFVTCLYRLVLFILFTDANSRAGQ